MRVDWPTILDNCGVEYVDRGPNTPKGCYNVKCPMCREDPSHHMVLNPDTGRFRCWRDKRHSGRDPAYILSLLTGMSRDMARATIGSAHGELPADDLRSRISRLFGPPGERDRDPAEPYRMPEGALDPMSRPGRRFFRYLTDVRGFDEAGAARAVARWGLVGYMGGRLAYRLAAPIRDPWTGRLCGVTGRAIVKSRLRYLEDPGGGACAAVPYARPFLTEGRVLLWVEGPVDAWKVDAYAPPSLRVAAFRTVSPSAAFLAAALRLSSGYARVYVLTDRGASAAGEALRSALSPAGARSVRLPEAEGGKDPGGLSPRGARDLAKSLVEG